MASSLPPTTIHHHHRRHRCQLTANISFTRFLAGNYTAISSIPISFLLQGRSYPSPIFNTNSRRCGRCTATSPRPPSPPQPEPSSDDEQFSSSGLPAKLSRFQDTVQIFFAVLFWMSLFFWSSVWDRKNNGRSDKGPPFKR